MNVYEAIFMIAILVLMVSQPYLQNQVLYRYCVLIIMPFVISYLFYSAMLDGNITFGKVALYSFFLCGLAYQAVKFYHSHIHQSQK